jgi:hypothetical protein
LLFFLAMAERAMRMNARPVTRIKQDSGAIAKEIGRVPPQIVIGQWKQSASWAAALLTAAVILHCTITALQIARVRV